MATLKVPELGEFLREQRTGAKLSLRQLAEVAGVSNPYLSQVERGLRKPSAEVLQQIAKGLRISAEVLYVRAGILDEREGRAEVETAILSDPHLSERQRRVLLDVYASFRFEAEQGTTATLPSTPTPLATPRKIPRKAPRKKASDALASGSADRTTAGNTARRSTGGQ